MTTSPKSDVLAELRSLLEAGDFFHSDYARLEELIPRIAALIEACGPFDVEPPASAHDDQLVTPSRSLPASAYRKLSAALRDLGT